MHCYGLAMTLTDFRKFDGAYKTNLMVLCMLNKAFLYYQYSPHMRIIHLQFKTWLLDWIFLLCAVSCGAKVSQDPIDVSHCLANCFWAWVANQWMQIIIWVHLLVYWFLLKFYKCVLFRIYNWVFKFSNYYFSLPDWNWAHFSNCAWK